MADENAKSEKSKARVRKNMPKDRRRSRPSERAMTRLGLDKQEAAYKKRRENVAFEIKAKRKSKETENSPQRIKDFWRAVQKRQAEQMKKAKVSTFPAKISHVRIVTNREGEEVVKVSFAGGGSMQDTGDRIRMIHDIHRNTPSPDKIYLLMMAVKEKGWKAVEGQIPAELRDEVLKACAQAGVSLTQAETKKEAVQTHTAKAQYASVNIYADPENAPKMAGSGAYNPLPVFDFRNIDEKRRYVVNDNVVQNRDIWKKYAEKRRDNACKVFDLSAQEAQAYRQAVADMQAHKDEWTQLRKSGQLTPEAEAEFKKRNDLLARKEAFALAIATGFKTPEEIEALRGKNLPSESPEMRDLWQLRDVAQLGSPEQARAFLRGDRSMMKEINRKKRELVTQNQLEENAAAMGVPVPQTKAEKRRLNRDFEYWNGLCRAHDNDMDAVKRDFQKYLMMDEEAKKAESSRLKEEVNMKNGGQKAPVVETKEKKMMRHGQEANFVRVAEMLGKSSDEIDLLLAMPNNKSEKKAINQAVNGYLPQIKNLSEEEQQRKLREFVALPSEKRREIIKAPNKKGANFDERRQNKPHRQAKAEQRAESEQKTDVTYKSAEPQEAVAVKMSFMMAALKNPQDEMFADMDKALKELGIRSEKDFYDEKKMTKALQIGKKAYGLDAWNVVREAKGQAPLSAEIWQKRAKPAKDNQAREEAYALAIATGFKTPEEIEALRKQNLLSKSKQMQELFDLRDVAQLGTKEQAQAFLNGDRSMMKEINDKNSAQKAQSALEEKAAVMGVPVPQTPEERKELNRDFEYWQNLRRANGNDMNAVKQGFAKYRSMDDTAQKAERMRLAEEVAVKNKASAAKPNGRESTLALMQKVARPHEMSLAEKMQARGREEEKEQLSERLEKLKSRNRTQEPVRRKSDRGAKMDRYMHDFQGRA